MVPMYVPTTSTSTTTPDETALSKIHGGDMHRVHTALLTLERAYTGVLRAFMLCPTANFFNGVHLFRELSLLDQRLCRCSMCSTNHASFRDAYTVVASIL